MSSRYQYSLTVFSSSGKLVQIEHALQAVAAGRPTIGIIANNGVVIVSEKRLPSILYDETTISKIEKICPHIGMSYSGMSPDFRLLVVHARKIAVEYKLKYGEYPTPAYVAQEIAKVMQEYTQQNGVRPFGVSLLLCGFYAGKPYLFQCDPSGAYFQWKATALGKNSANYKTFLKRRSISTIADLEDAVYMAIATLKEFGEGKLNEDNIQISVCDSEGYKSLSNAKIKDYLDASSI